MRERSRHNIGMTVAPRHEAPIERPSFSTRDTLRGMTKAVRMAVIGRIDRRLPTERDVKYDGFFEVSVTKDPRGTEVIIADDTISPGLGQYTSIHVGRGGEDGKLIVYAESYYYDDFIQGESYFYHSSAPDVYNTLSLENVLSRLQFAARVTKS